jgi:hypothetical protein
MTRVPSWSVLTQSALVAALTLLGGEARAQGLAPMAGASAIQGTLQGTSTPAYTGVLDRARNTINTATSNQAAGSGTAGAVGGAPSGASAPSAAAPNLASGAPSGASINGKPIPVCSHGGLCQGAMMRAIGRP